MLRVGVLASGGGTNLQALLDTVHGVSAEIVAVASDQPAAPALARAEGAGIPTAVFERSAHPDRAARDEAIAAWLTEHEVELVVLAGYMALLTPGFVVRFRDRIINVHPSLLPAFPGLRAVEQAVEYGVKVYGVTVHIVDEGMDTGMIIAQRAIEMPAGADPERALAALRPLEHELLPEVVAMLGAGRR
jgi:phosphoribosylglycinamide formyltransferase-1